MTPDRDETDAERYDRNWTELVQELRVAQTGIQVLAGFLLTLPFTQRFGSISTLHRDFYLLAVGLAVLTVGLMTAPVSLHRFLFGRHEKGALVRVGGTFAKAGLTTLGLTFVVVTTLIFGVVVSDVAGFVAGALVLVLYAVTWVAIPAAVVREDPEPPR